MALHWFLVCHGMMTLTVIISFLCGQWPIFKGTPFQWIHNFITFGAYDYFLKFFGLVFGSKGTDVILSVEYFCCDRPNPILQVIYIAIIGSTYYFTAKSSFVYIPGYYIGDVHKYTSFLAIIIGVILFLLTSFSDPGTVNVENISKYISAYPYDDIIYSERECSTCKILKHFLLCLYGAVAIGFILAGRVEELRVVHILTVYYGVDKSFRSLAPRVLQWLVATYNTQILLMVFLGIISLLLAGFFAYHAKLCLTNTTTNETFKWRECISLKKKLSEAKASAAAHKAGMAFEPKKPLVESKCFGFCGRSSSEAEAKAEAIAKRNLYDRGSFQNISEIIFPLSSRPSSSNKSKQKPE